MRLALCLVCLFGCTDYGFKWGEDPEFPGTPPADVLEVNVSVDVISNTTSCGIGLMEVLILNIGSEDLEFLDAHVNAPDWVMTNQEALPATLAPGEERLLNLIGSGSATLTISTNDPDTPEVSVPLLAIEDLSPTVTIQGYQAGEVLPIGLSTSLEATVSDDVDDLTHLELVWSSDVDGPLGTSPVNEDGTSHLTDVVLSPGTHEIWVSVLDSCDGLGEDILSVCQQAGYTEDSIDLIEWQFEGNAFFDGTGGWVELTSAVNWQVGSAFQTGAVISGNDVNISFQFYVGAQDGADGFALTALDLDRMTSFLGPNGGGLGYGVGVESGEPLPGWSIEVDTWYNSGIDVSPEDHVSFTFDGSLLNPVVTANLPEMEDDTWHEMVISVSAPHVHVTIDGITYIDEALEGYFDFPAYVGFTASTGISNNHHRIDALAVTSMACDE